MPQARSSRRYVLWALALLVLAIGGFAYWRHAEAVRQASSRPPPPPAPVEVATVEKRDVPVYVDSLGTVQPLNLVTVRSRVDGQIVKVNFTEGQIVKEGDVLVQIDPAPFKAALDGAVAKLAEDQANLTNANQQLVRAQSLAKTGFGTQQTLDQAVASVGNLNALVQADQASITNAKVQLDYTTIRAPITGRAGFRQIDIGNIVNAAGTSGIVTLAQIEPITVVFTAPEDRLAAIQAATAHGKPPIVVYSPDGTKELAHGELTAVDNQVDQASGTIRLKGTFANTDHKLWPGLSVSTRLLVDTLHQVLTVPDVAVQRGPDELFAYTVDNAGTAHVKQLKVGQIADGTAVIESGLAEGEKVITSGQYRVEEGTEVQIINGNSGPVAKAPQAGQPQ